MFADGEGEALFIFASWTSLGIKSGSDIFAG
jgi:hypothetical protein